MPSAKPYNVYNQSCIQGLREHVADDSVDLIFTDPPYGIDGDELDVHYNRDESKVVPGYIDVPLTEYAKFSRDWITECARVLRPGGSMYIVSGYTNLHHILNALHATDLQEVNHIIAQYSFGVSTKNKFVRKNARSIPTGGTLTKKTVIMIDCQCRTCPETTSLDRCATKIN